MKDYDNKKKTYLLCWTALIVVVLLFLLYMIVLVKTSYALINEVENRVSDIELRQNDIRSELNVSRLKSLEIMNEPTKVLFTNYGLWDNHSTDTTASMLNTSDFRLNSAGMYTFENKVVIATANLNRLQWALKEGYNSHDLFDELVIEVDGINYDAIVLDVCGACYFVEGEDYQRYDIFTKDNVIGKLEGYIYE